MSDPVQTLEQVIEGYDLEIETQNHSWKLTPVNEARSWFQQGLVESSLCPDPPGGSEHTWKKDACRLNVLRTAQTSPIRLIP